MKTLSLIITVAVLCNWHLWKKSENSEGAITKQRSSQRSVDTDQAYEEKNENDLNEVHTLQKSDQDLRRIAQIEAIIAQYENASYQEAEGPKFQHFLELKSKCENEPSQICADFFLRELNDTSNPIHFHSFGLSAYLANAKMDNEEKIIFLESFRYQKSGELMKEDIEKTISYLQARH